MRIALLFAAIAGASAQCQNSCVEYCGCESYDYEPSTGMIFGSGCRADCFSDDLCGGFDDCRDLGVCSDCVPEEENDDPCNDCIESCSMTNASGSHEDFCDYCVADVCYQICVDTQGFDTIDGYIEGGCNDGYDYLSEYQVVYLFEDTTDAPSDCLPLAYGGGSIEDIVDMTDEEQDHCCDDEEYCCGGPEKECGEGSDSCGFRFLCFDYCVPDDSKCRTYGDDCWAATTEPQECADGYLPAIDYTQDKLLCYPPGCEAYDIHEDTCSPDDSKCRTYGDDCWGASSEPQECADGYLPAIDYTQDKLLCYPPGCEAYDIRCEHDESKCRTDGDDCWGATHEPQECADGYQPLVDYEEDYLYCFPPACEIAYSDGTMDCRDCSTSRSRNLLFARLPCC